MDVTPQELRDIEIRESFRGYHRDEVDELLERAAATIEHLEHQIRILQERLAAGAAAPAPKPAAAPAPVPDSDVIQRTLILAQRAADEAVAEAQARAQQLTSEAEAKAQALVSEAESTARRIAESERRRIEAEIAQLTATRDALSADVDRLEQFAVEYRDRIRRAIEAELERLRESSSQAEPLPPRPALSTEGMALPAGTSPPAVEAAAPPRPTETEPTSAIEAVQAVGLPEPAPSWETGPEPGPAWGGEQASWSSAAPTASDDSWGGAGTSGGEEWGTDSLDDDAFFASLREAVRDDEPLGPRDEYVDEDDTDASRKLFRRRR